MPPDQEQSIRKQVAKLGTRLPKIIAEKPELEYDEIFIWRAFWELSTERYPSNRGGISPIPVCKIYEYCNYTFIPESYVTRFFYCVRQMDMHYVKLLNDEALAARKNTGKK